MKTLVQMQEDYSISVHQITEYAVWEQIRLLLAETKNVVDRQLCYPAYHNEVTCQ